MGFLDKWNVMYARNVKIKMNNLYLKNNGIYRLLSL